MGNDAPDYAHRKLVNLLAAIALLALGVVFVIAMNLIDGQRKLQRCVDSGRRDCFAIPTAPMAQGTQR